MTIQEQRFQKTSAFLAQSHQGEMVLIDEYTMFVRSQLFDASWSDWEAGLPRWQVGTDLVVTGEKENTLVSSGGRVFTRVTAY